MIKPILQNDAFLDDVHEARHGRNGDRFHLWWLGQSGFLLQWQDRHLLLDPYLSDSLTRKYANTDKPHIRMTEPVIAPGRLDFIDVVTSSHHHTDHLDADTLVPLFKVNPNLRLLIPETNRAFTADRLKMDPQMPHGLDAGQSVTLGGFEFHAVPAAHETVEKDDQGRCKFLGYIVRFGPWTVYHSGDTMHYDGMTDWLKPWRIDLAILPINGRAPERRVAGNLNGREAAQLAHEIGAKTVIPCHFEMFTFNTASPQEFIDTAQELKQSFCVLRAGERYSGSASDQRT